ncbi:(2Fe-2S)-binding protein [Yoonia sp. 208BN28-4]|uniref:(2Fe-2S)-binding protein n=1 Tax=Yoonia sp. 208BN28-4 TaxID=3126505 RepID=UPI0030A4A437
MTPKRGTARVVFRRDKVLIGALCVAPTPVAVMRDYLCTLSGQNAPESITGCVPKSVPNPGPVLCSCFGMGINTIVTAIETKGLMSVESIGEVLGAGTNCGSCRPEMAQLLARMQVREAATALDRSGIAYLPFETLHSACFDRWPCATCLGCGPA